MQARQRSILIVLVLLTLIQQGFSWKIGCEDVNTTWENSVGVATVQAAPPVQKAEGHCSLVHVNTAGMAELQTLPGIGPIYAERIIIARKEQPFLEKRDLLRVAGIGEKRLAEIADLICLYFEKDAE